ncbi:TetR family transcriptional regulator [Paenibacillus cellulosilyticus]|uniref:TetR family transcriptional regulator n=1 Tax=Paenibacillus cellulosilyticus TaxID=375489 RepID=A0A2V2YCF6_9BACL|nr:TetR/AcrR family transcriptional regulator [Paenibacillus cellulosilyticus]PWV89412.1 TetR family transcriptional regulator [Paenibacillus cellulosilyticus]QKS47297.1 TetR/AcrR family transcriptional regulator [Paenibacillus cellulosilyticus]
MPRISKDPQERKDEIVNAAMELFASKGYEQTSVSDIVKKIGVAQGTFYYYFQSKEEVIHAACERTLASRLEKVKDLVDSTQWNALDKLTRLFTEASPNEEDVDVFEYLHQEINSTLHQKWIVAEIMALLPYARQIVQQGVEEGIFHVRQPELAVEFLLVGASFWFDKGIFDWNEQEYEAKRQTLTDFIDRLLVGSPLVSPDA